MSTISLPKYVIVGGAQRLISFDAVAYSHEFIPSGTYIPTLLSTGHVLLTPVRGGKPYTVHRDVWPVALADYRIMEA